MHELSIASALAELVAQHAPARAVVRTVLIEAGPLQCIDPEAMKWAWQSVTAGGPYAATELQIHFLPWRMRCSSCGREWDSPEMADRCACGSAETFPVDGRELRLRSLTVDDPSPQENPHASAGDRKRTQAE